MNKDNTLVLIENRKAYYDYVILDKMEVGIVLSGTEVKSLSQKMASLNGSYVQVLRNELWLVGSSISLYDNGSVFNHKQICARKLLCHKRQLADLKHKSEAKGFTIIPLKFYVNNGKIKLEIGIARGKNVADKRETIKKNELRRELERYV